MLNTQLLFCEASYGMRRKNSTELEKGSLTGASDVAAVPTRQRGPGQKHAARPESTLLDSLPIPLPPRPRSPRTIRGLQRFPYFSSDTMRAPGLPAVDANPQGPGCAPLLFLAPPRIEVRA